jgi:Xaa-Pro aminopeptidase
MLGYYLEPIEAGMFLSNEPGYYKDGEFGIRIESDMIAKKHAPRFKSGSRSFLEFETLTKVCKHVCVFLH